MPKHPRNYLSLLLLCVTGALSAAEEIVIFGDNDYRPVIFEDAQRQSAGILSEVLRQFAQDSGTEVNIKLYPWKRAYTNAEKGLGGVIGLSRTPERMQIFDFSAPIYDDSINVVVLKGKEFPFNSLADLEGRIIGVQSGASYGSEVDAAIAAGQLSVEADQGHISRLNKLLHGRIEAAFIGNGQRGLQALLESDSRLAANQEQFVVLPRQLASDLLYLGFAKPLNQQPLLDRFNRWLIEAQEKQTIEQLVRMQATQQPNASAETAGNHPVQ